MSLVEELRSKRQWSSLREIVWAEIGFPGGASSKEHACQCRRLRNRRFDP